MARSSWRKLIAALAAVAPQRGNQRLISLVSFDILVQHTPINYDAVYTTKVKGCRYLGDSDDMKEGPDADQIEITLNGEPVRATLSSAQETLLDFLRSRGLTGAKEGCAEGECGTCTVALVATEGDRPAFRAVNSCLMFLPMAAGHEIITVEALARDGHLSDAQQAMASAGGSQCGYCTPGFVMSLFAEQYRHGRSGPCEIGALAGNLCRCTGYRPIRDAALSLGAPADERFLARLRRPAPVLGARFLQGFSRPASLTECVELLSRDRQATLIAGGTDLTVASNLRGRRWPHLVSVEAIDELRTFEQSASRVRIGAAVPLTDIGRRWTDIPPVVSGWLALFASPPVRNRATLGGNLATASPIGDAAPLLLALDAQVQIAGIDGRRALPISEFFPDYRRTALREGEMLVAIDIPLPLPASVRFYKVAKRRADDISTVAAAIALDRDAAGAVRYVRLAFGGVAATPVRVLDAERAISDSGWNEPGIGRALEAIGSTLRPLSDHRGSAAYRLRIAQRLVEKFAWEIGG
jgi:xanthine dehydrogenase small subunit